LRIAALIVVGDRADIYASTALAGSAVYLAMRGVGMPVAVRIAAGVATTASMRMGAWTHGVRLPTWGGDTLVKNWEYGE
jgi:uncharacterized membrane protein YeiH